MRPKSLALLLVALGCGLMASVGITQVLAKRNAEPAGMAGDMQSIFVTVTDIPLGDLVTPDMLKLEQWPKDKIPKGSISRIEDIDGRRARAKLYAGEPILENRLLGKGASEQGATALIPKGYRVVPVKVDLVSGGSSMIVPGDRVDVMGHFVRDPSREIQETATQTILQDIKVFAVNDVVDLEREKEGIRSITAKTISLLVTPDQAARLMLATQMGTINLVMRSPEDDEQIANAKAKPSELFGKKEGGDRAAESLVQEEPAKKDKNQSFLEFLGSMKKHSATGPATAPATPETWVMRILKPGEVSDVELQSDKGGGRGEVFPMGGWKSSTMSGNATPSQPAKDVSAPAATTDPASEEPAPEEPGETTPINPKMM